MKYAYAVVIGLAACLALVGAACNDSSDDGGSIAPAPAATSDSAPTAPAPAATQAPEPPPASQGIQASPDQVRELVFNGLMQESGISEPSAQCVVDNMSDDLLERYITLDVLTLEDPQPEDFEAAQPVFAEMFEIQSGCLTPEEMEMMGFMPADG